MEYQFNVMSDIRFPRSRACEDFFFFFLTFWPFLSSLPPFLPSVFDAVRGLSLVAASGSYSFVAMRRLLVAVASLVVEHGL